MTDAKSPTLTIVAAAELMGVKRRWAHRLLTKRHKRYPELGLLTRPSGSQRGNLVVDARALREIIRGGATEAIEDLRDRVGFLEADSNSLDRRVKRLEKSKTER